MMNTWPFDQPQNCGTIISRAILEGRNAILYVSHDEDDHGWQFLDNETFEAKDAALVCLSHVVGLDPSVVEVADLEPGWIATRSHLGAVWVRELAPPEDEDDE
ncbi:hypothetical protein GTP41_12465 [Pseudoduganella sp. DS3]|uniref:DUF2185 domain-containing protein n=2 Tax=Pseudoduganella guangdongensis TaxID=2692179 RepID=A0A6N9HH80_9BURK|nr:hypothetical protein [Pseudoduganella guangdongensis]